MNKRVNKPHLSYKKNMDNMKLLASFSEFQTLVGEARKFLDIPEEGLLNGKDSEKWHKGFVKKSDFIIESKSFNERCKKISEKLKSGEITRNIANEQLKLLHQQIPINYLTNMVKFIVDKFYLPLNYQDSIRRYILLNKIEAPYNNFIVGPYINIKKMSDVRFVPITIYAKLTREEIKDLQKEIDLVGENLPVFNPLKDIDKKLAFEEWLKEENRQRSSYDEEYVLTVAEIAEDKLGSTKKVKSIYDAIKGLKDLRKKRFKQSGKTEP
ncbi:MAG: hypothetical protein Q8P32_00825 [Candidatus Komeilibacteria bacterium]|nr:hypothetical protein [Candidatus Komeilibacteria bacterium]